MQIIGVLFCDLKNIPNATGPKDINTTLIESRMKSVQSLVRENLSYNVEK